MITRMRRSRWRGSSEIAESEKSPLIDFAAVTDFKDEDNQYFLLERTEDTVIAHAILPKMMELSLEPLTNLARIF